MLQRDFHLQIALNLFTYESRYSRMDQVKFVEDSLWKTWGDMVCLSRAYPFEFFKRCLPQILLGALLNTLSHMPFFINTAHIASLSEIYLI